VCHLPGGQLGCKGNVINFKQDLSEFVQVLPRKPKDLPLMIIKPNGFDLKKNITTFRKYSINYRRVEAFLQHAVSSKLPGYEKVTIDMGNLANINEEEIGMGVRVISEDPPVDDEREEEHDDGPLCASAVDDDATDSSDYQCMIAKPVAIQREDDSIRDAVDQMNL